MRIGKSLLEGISVYFYEKNTPSPRQTTQCESLENSVQSKARQSKTNTVFEKFMNILH